MNGMYRLLIVDDPEGCAAAQRLLDWQSCGVHEVVTAHSVGEGISLALELQPELMFLGLGRDWGLAEQLRAAGLPTLFAVMSADREPEQIIQAMRAGARDFLAKPLDEGEVRAFLERIIPRELGGGLNREQDVDPVLRVPCSALSRITGKIVMTVRADYHRSQTLSLIAERMHMSSKYIGRVFLRETGMRFSEYLMAYRMLEARKRILGTREKISVIAGMVGYTQLNNFYIHFRRYFGISPGDLRAAGGSEKA